MMLLAQLPATTEVKIGAWIVAAAAVMVVVNQAFHFARNVKGDAPHPPNASLDLRVNTVERDLHNHIQDDKEYRASVGMQIKEMRDESDRGRRRLYRRTDQINAMLQRMAGKMGVHVDDYTKEDESQ